MKSVATVVVLAGLLVAVGCSSNPVEQTGAVILNVSRLDAPAKVAAAGPLDVVLIVSVGGCVSFDRIEAERSPSGATLTAWGFDSRKGNLNLPCPQNFENQPHFYRFDPPFASTFDIYVNRGRLSPLTARVLVQ